MMVHIAADRQAFQALLPVLNSGDCVQISSFAAVAANCAELFEAAEALETHGAELISLNEGIDTRTEGGKTFFAVCRSLRALDDARPARRRDGIEKAKEEGRYKGRKPIAVDESLFDSVVSLWQSGEITAREAMAKLDLKPNTFYRRIKEREEQKMKDYKKVEHEIKEEIREAAKQSRKDLDELKKQVRTEAREVKKTAEEKLELHDVEREMRHDRIRAEAEHHEALKQMKKDVQAEAKELKKLMESEN
jgi:DNA invertase Pin-like site-specific DNA recombinase